MKTKQTTVWAITADSESGDSYGPFLTLNEPTQKELKILAFKLDGEIVEADGPGDFGSYVYITKESCVVYTSLDEAAE